MICSLVCPVPDCIEMVQVREGFEPVTWSQHMDGQGEIAARPDHYVDVEE